MPMGEAFFSLHDGIKSRLLIKSSFLSSSTLTCTFSTINIRAGLKVKHHSSVFGATFYLWNGTLALAVSPIVGESELAWWWERDKNAEGEMKSLNWLRWYKRLFMPTLCATLKLQKDFIHETLLPVAFFN